MIQLKKLVLMIFIVFLFTVRTAYAGFDTVLNDMLSEYGVYDGEKGVIYASIDNFTYEEPFLFLCYTDGEGIKCSLYNNGDGVQCVDTLEIEFRDNIILSSVVYDETTYLMIDDGRKEEYFAILGDSFSHIPELEYSKKSIVFEIKKNKLKSQMSYKDIYNFLNSMKKEKISAYPFMNKINTLDSSLYDELKNFIASCADLTSFDSKNYEYDRIFKYVLFTHRNFKPLVQINPHTDESDTVKRVNAEFIDYIMQNILGIVPEHPESTDLVKRGFCYRDGLYLYKGGFSADYKTEILDLEAVHDLGGGRYHIIFSDIYTENGKSVPEYSYIIADTSKQPYRLLRIGMGKTLLRTEQIREYALSSDLTTPAWEMERHESEEGGNINALLWAALFALALVACTVILIVIIRKK